MKRWIVLLVGLALVSFVSPFSYLPNPLGVVYVFTGGYRYDARLPFFVNGFAVVARGNLEGALRQKLDGLIGTTGLDPLDPNHPLRQYEIEQVEFGEGDWAQVTARMIYADGSSRRYQIPVIRMGQIYTGLDRFFAPHVELPDLPLVESATSAAADQPPVQLGAPERLPISNEAHRLGTDYLAGWYTSTSRPHDEPVWSPSADAFLLAVTGDPRSGGTERQFWLVYLDGRRPIWLASNVDYYGWSGDGSQIVFLRGAKPTGSSQVAGWELVATDRNAQRQRVLAVTSVAAAPSLVGEWVWYLDRDDDVVTLWRLRLRDEHPERVIDLQDAAEQHDGTYAFAVAPDGRRVAYRCGDALCLVDVDSQRLVRADLGAPEPALQPVSEASAGQPAPPATQPPASRPGGQPAPTAPTYQRLAIAWSPLGDRLAVVATGIEARPRLFVVNDTGRILQQAALGPNGTTRSPQWTPSGKWIVLNAFPSEGRRILGFEAASGRIFDLSQPRWDTFVSLAPDGERLLLWNGRGGFWTVAVAFSDSPSTPATAATEPAAPVATPTPHPTPVPSSPTPRATATIVTTPTVVPTTTATTRTPTSGSPTPATTRTPSTTGTPSPVVQQRLVGPREVPVSSRYEPLPLVIDLELEAKLRDYLAEDLSHYGIVVKRISDGRGVAIQPERQFYAASLFKLLVMDEVYKQRQLGLLGFDETLPITPLYLEYQLGPSPWPEGSEVPIHELLEAMIVSSDNVAANLLLDKVGSWNVIRDFQAIGLTGTALNGGDDMPTTARDMAVWMERIALGQAMDEATSREMVELLAQQKVRDRLPALLPEEVVVANKTGNWENATHDVGIVYAPSGTYVIAVLTDYAWRSQPIAEISRLVFDHFQEVGPASGQATSDDGSSG